MAAAFPTQRPWGTWPWAPSQTTAQGPARPALRDPGTRSRPVPQHSSGDSPTWSVASQASFLTPGCPARLQPPGTPTLGLPACCGAGGQPRGTPRLGETPLSPGRRLQSAGYHQLSCCECSQGTEPSPAATPRPPEIHLGCHALLHAAPCFQNKLPQNWIYRAEQRQSLGDPASLAGTVQGTTQVLSRC